MRLLTLSFLAAVILLAGCIGEPPKAPGTPELGIVDGLGKPDANKSGADAGGLQPPSTKKNGTGYNESAYTGRPDYNTTMFGNMSDEEIEEMLFGWVENEANITAMNETGK
ncbi:MAG: hypothetical protein ACP5NX_02020 [Candidatus Bilamarchaeaceae archaeon]